MNKAAERLRGSMAGTLQTTADGITWFDPENELDAALAAERAAGAAQGLDVERLTRTLWNMPNNAQRWLKAEGDTREFAAAIAAEYARLSEPTE